MQLSTILDVSSLTKFSPTTIEHWAYGRRPAPAGFPSPIRAGRQIRYIQEEIDAWIRGRAAARPGNDEDARLKDVTGIPTAPARRGRGRPSNAEKAALRVAAEKAALVRGVMA